MKQNETRDWYIQSWNRADWDSWEYYFGPFMTGYGENIPATQGKGKAEGGKHLRGMAK